MIYLVKHLQCNAPQNQKRYFIMNDDIRPIGVFDSGVGGISVLRELTSLMPNENFIYFGDSANAPYGTKTLDKVRELTLATGDFLIRKNCKCLVVACNTATAAGVRPLRALYPEVPVIGIEPALKPAVTGHPGGTVLVLATPVTLREEKFHRLLDRYKEQASVFTLGCPGIVEYVEQGITKGPRLMSYLNELLNDYTQNPPDGVVLGCTHYPFVRSAISEVLGGHSDIYDGGAGTARETLHQLTIRGICAPSDANGTVTLLNSNPALISLEKKLLNHMEE